MNGNKTFFPIIMWMEANPNVMNYDKESAEAFYEKSFSDIKSLHCNTVRPSNLPLDYADQFIRAAACHDLNVILDPQWGHNIINMPVQDILEQWDTLKNNINREVIQPFSGYKNLLGYAVIDEPKSNQLEQWNLIVKMFNELDPVHPDFTVFNEPDNLQIALNIPGPFPGNIVYDNYPHEIFVKLQRMGTPEKPCYDWYNRYKGFSGASTIRQGVPQVSTVATFKNENPWRFPTPEEFRTTVFTSLAAGVKGIMFFIYMDVPSEERLVALVDWNWKPNPYPPSYPPFPPLYETVKLVAEELEKLGPILAGLEWNGIVNGWEPEETMITSSYKSQYTEYFIIAHKDPDPSHASLTWSTTLPNQYCLRDIASGEAFRPESSGKVTVPLTPAQGRSLKKQVYQDKVLFGSFDLPPIGIKNAAGAIALTGWALGVSPVTGLEIKRSPVPDDPKVIIGKDGLIKIGDALFVKGTRPDIAEIYSEYQNADNAGWGYMLLTNTLPNKGNGEFIFHAIAHDSAGNTVILGEKIIQCNNEDSIKPFGAIDTPAPGEVISGTSYVNFGWALTPVPNKIPQDGSTVTVLIDEKPLKTIVYNQYRKDIAEGFPGLKNSEGAGGYCYIDTTQYDDGLHTISWNVRDNAGNEDGIGSRYFRIKNK